MATANHCNKTVAIVAGAITVVAVVLGFAGPHMEVAKVELLLLANWSYWSFSNDASFSSKWTKR